MYEELHFYARPRDEEVIWRFMDLSKLIYILAHQALPFIRLDLFEDKFEGYIPKGNIIVDTDLKDIPPEQQTLMAEKLNKNNRNLARKQIGDHINLFSVIFHIHLVFIVSS